MEWINVKDRIPTRKDADVRENILAIAKMDGFARLWIWSTIAYNPEEYTHWIPLSKLPKEGGE